MDEELKPEEIGIQFKATFYKFTTLADGGVRLSFDLSLSELSEAIRLPKLGSRLLQVAIIPEPKRTRQI